MRTAKTRYAKTSDGISIAYTSVGDGAPIVFAANNCDSLNYSYPEFHGLADGLADLGWQVIQHDTRGTGGSDRGITEWGLEPRIRDLESIVNRVAVERFVLAASDQGCATAIAYAVRNPERVSHLVLLCPWANGAAQHAYPSVRQAMSPAPVGRREWNVQTNIIGGVLTEFVDPSRQRQVANAIRNNTSAENFAAINKAAASIDVTGLLSAVCVPTLILFDQTFPFASFDLCKDVAAGIPGARLVVMNESFMMGPRFEQTVATIDRFLRGSIERATDDRPQTEHAPLTPRERDVLRLIAAGRANKEIAAHLGMSERTAARHITNLYAKIGAHNKAAATAYAIRHKLT